MYPEGHVKTFGDKVKGWVWGSSDSSKGMDIPSHDQVQQQCLSLYLQRQKQLLLSCQVENIKLCSLSIHHIFKQMFHPLIHHHGRSHSWPADGVPKV